jgi:CDP-glucose 4,6-dehydratase
MKPLSQQFWKNKRVFLTGHTGFKGSWMSLVLSNLGAEIKGYSLAPPTSPSLFNEAKLNKLISSEINDIRDFSLLSASINNFSPEIIIHMAAQPLVRASYSNPLETYQTNVLGTANLLQASLVSDSVKAIINITTDKCYENKEFNIAFKETDPMGGHDPYSSSKGCAELVTSAYRESFFKERSIGIASVRAGNVIGGGDWAEDRLIPDILRAFEANQPVLIRNPKSTRPWQHVLEPVFAYLRLAEELYENPNSFSEGWNFGPNPDDIKPVDWILNNMIEMWPGNSWQSDISENPHEAKTLRLDISKAKRKLNWHPVWDLRQSLSRIINWHKSWVTGTQDIQKLCLQEILEYKKDYEDGQT